jgi:hypothetical protein
VLPLHKIEWTERTTGDGMTMLVGTLRLHRGIKILPNLLGGEGGRKARREIKTALWRDVYGELTTPIADLQRAVRMEEDGVRELCETINNLLRDPP